MTALQKNVQSVEFSSDFDLLTAPQKAYTHGLESIYKLECIDLKSVRKFSGAVEQSVKKFSWEEASEPQLSLDLGPFFRGWMVPSLLQEPTQVLQLSKPVEKTLLEKGYKTLGELEKASLQSLGLGQGHIEEIRRKLKGYIEGKPRLRISRIDFQSVVKCLFADLDWKKASVFLSSYDIADWLLLSPADSVDVKKLSFDNRVMWQKEVMDQMKNEPKALQVQSFFSSIAETWIKPWMMVRGGLATREEILEGLLLRSTDPMFAKAALQLFLALGDPFHALFPISGGFAASKTVQKVHEKIEKTALSYFKNPSAQIFLKDLDQWVAEEFAKDWEAVNPEKSIRFSPRFDFFRTAKNGEWMVAKNFFGGR